MQTYIKLTPHFLENLQKYWIYSHTFWIYSKNVILFKKYWFWVKQMMFIQQKSWFYLKKMFFLMFFVTRMFGQSLFFHQQIFNHTLSGRKFPMHMWMNLMTAAPQVTAKQLDLFSGNGFAREGPSDWLTLGWIACSCK